MERRYRYDAVGNLVDHVDSRLGRTAYVYDAAGYIRLRGSFAPGADFTHKTLPTERLKEQFHFDGAGNIREQPSPLAAKATKSADEIRKLSYQDWANQARNIHQAQAQVKPAESDRYAIKSNRLETYQDHRYRYDEQGRVIEKISGSSQNQTQIQFIWDDVHQLEKSITTRSQGQQATEQSTTYTYDALGRRLTKTDSFATTQFIWSGDQMLGERRGNQTSTYVYEPNSFVPMARLDNLHCQEPTDEQEDNETATPISEDYLPSYPYPDLPHLYQQWREPGTGRILDLPVGKNDPRRIAAQATASTDANEWGQARVYHFQTDQIGTPRELTAHSGELAWQAEYKVWGNTVTCEWLQQEPQKIEQNLRFQGQYYDAETGLHYNRFRYYDADVGRFVSHDPIGLLGGQNIYAYAPNPTGWVDVLGLTLKVNCITCKKCTTINKVTGKPRGFLQKLAQMIREAGKAEPAVNRRTIAVGQDSAGNLYAGSSNGFDAGQRDMSDKLGVTRVPSSKGKHAEENLLKCIQGLKSIGTSKRDPCGPSEHDCAGQMKVQNIDTDNI